MKSLSLPTYYVLQNIIIENIKILKIEELANKYQILKLNFKKNINKKRELLIKREVKVIPKDERTSLVKID